MTKLQAIEQTRDLSTRWPTLPWCVIDRNGSFVPKIYNGTINGNRLGIDYSESQIVWRINPAWIKAGQEDEKRGFGVMPACCLPDQFKVHSVKKDK